MTHVWRNKDKNHSGLFVRHHNKEEHSETLEVFKEKKPIDLKFYMEWNFPSKRKQK